MMPLDSIPPGAEMIVARPTSHEQFTGARLGVRMGGRKRKAPATRKRGVTRTRGAASTQRSLSRIQRALSIDLLHPDYAPSEDQIYFGCVGHCYVATEAAYHLFARKSGFVPYVLRHRHGTHWWLKNEETGEILDPTEPQLDGEAFPYENGRRQAFLTKRPSRRAAELIRRVKARMQ